MPLVKKIIISGLSGINKPPLELDFKKNNRYESMVIYGSNGTGKSSIVNAWEWFTTKKIEWLAREGAQASAYPHVESNGLDSYISVEFVDSKLGIAMMKFNVDKVTQPIVNDSWTAFKEQLKYPCHIRYRDLAEFVYLTKTQKYEHLARLLGLDESLNMINSLIRAEGRLKQEINALEDSLTKSSNEYYYVANEFPLDDRRFFDFLNTIFIRHDISIANNWTEYAERINRLTELVKFDKTSKDLDFWVTLNSAFLSLFPLAEMKEQITLFVDNVNNIKEIEGNLNKLVLLKLYEAGINAVNSLESYGSCPLCDTEKSNILEYIENKYKALEIMQKQYSALKVERNELVDKIKRQLAPIERALMLLADKELPGYFEGIKDKIISLKSTLELSLSLLQHEIVEIELSKLEIIDFSQIQFLNNSFVYLKDFISGQIDQIQFDKKRAAIVNDYQEIQNLQRIYESFKNKEETLIKLKLSESDFATISGDYKRSCKEYIEDSFSSISSDVARIFNILEKDTEHLSNPLMKLVSESDKAVELEINFNDKICISPAFKVLSESQLNSFGLAILLSYIKHFNKDFKFLILDDVINSFDIHKRPRVIEVLKQQFGEFQILILTHDSIWIDKIHREFPCWIKKRIFGWSSNCGPKIEPDLSTIERIDEYLTYDRPDDAGRLLGVYLENILQKLCERLRAKIDYKRSNQFTLDELITAFRVRLGDKISKQSDIYRKVVELESDSVFRNYCAHWKNPPTPYTTQEIRKIFSSWQIIERALECPSCNKFLLYQKNDSIEKISCPCGEYTSDKIRFDI
jgi:hypothetical protein